METINPVAPVDPDKGDESWRIMDQLKTAFKDESTISNIPMITIESSPETEASKENNNQHLQGLITVDEELSFHSCVVSPDERYVVQHTLQTFLNRSMDTTPQFPGIIDVSSIHDEGLGIQNISFDSDGDLGLVNLSSLNPSKVNLNKDDLLAEDDKCDLMGDNSIGDLSTDAGTLSTDGSSMIFNIWNEDYEGNPDASIMKRLVESKKLPRHLDPLVKTAVRRQRVLAELQELEDDESSTGSCNVLIGKMCMPTCGERDLDNDSLVDTIIQIDTGSTMDETASTGGSVEFADLIIRTSKGKKMKRQPDELRSQYELMSDKQYRPGVKPTDLIMMLPSTSFQPNQHSQPTLNPYLPVDQVKTIDQELLKQTGTYDEKDQEFTLQHYDSTPNRIAELVITGKRSGATDYNLSELKDQADVVDAVIEEPMFDLDAFKLTEKRMPLDYDPIDGDRSILSPSEIEAEKEEFLAYLAEREAEEKKANNFQSQILQMFSDSQDQSQAKAAEEEDTKSVNSFHSVNPAASNEENCNPAPGDSCPTEEMSSKTEANKTALGMNKPRNRSILSVCGQGFSTKSSPEDDQQQSGEDSQEQAPVSFPVVPIKLNKETAAALALQSKVEDAIRGNQGDCNFCNPVLPPGIEEVEDLLRLLDVTIDSDSSSVREEGEGEEVVMAMPVALTENTSAVPVIYPTSPEDSSGRFGILVNPSHDLNTSSPLTKSMEPIEKPTMELDFESDLEKEIIAQSPDECMYDNMLLQPAEVREDNHLNTHEQSTKQVSIKAEDYLLDVLLRKESTEGVQDDNFSDASNGVESVLMDKKPESSLGSCDNEMFDISNGYESVNLPVSTAKSDTKKKEKKSKKKHNVSDDLNDLRNVLKANKSTPMKTKHTASAAKNLSLLDSISSQSRPELTLGGIAH